MPTLERIGRVSIVSKGDKLYLRATLPSSDGEMKSRWVSTGLGIGDIRKAGLTARELDTDLERYRMGYPFPEKWSCSRDSGCFDNELDSLRDSLFGGKEGKKDGDKRVRSLCPTGREEGKEYVGRLRSAWHSFFALQSQYWEPSTTRSYQEWGNVFLRMMNALDDRVGSKTALQVNCLIRNWLIENTTMRQARIHRQRINRLIRGYIPDVPVLEELTPVTLEARKMGKSKARDYFTADERDAICQSFLALQHLTIPRNHPSYEVSRHFHQQAGWYASFCFYTGCRLGEAAGLLRSDINLSTGHIFFHQRCARTDGGYTLLPGLKTQDYRYFPINEQLVPIIEGALSLSEEWEPGGKMIFVSGNRDLFRMRSLFLPWQKALVTLGIRHRKPYCMRATFISLCLAKGIPCATIADWVGNSPETIYKHYAGVTPSDVPLL